MAALITFIGGEECGNIGSNEWADPMHGYSVNFPINEPVLIDPDNEPNPSRRAFLENILRRAPNNRFYRVEAEDTPAPKRGRPAKGDA